MSESTKRKVKAMLMAGLLIGSLLLLIAGIESVQFKAGTSIRFFEFDSAASTASRPTEQFVLGSLLYLTTTILIIMLIYLVLKPRSWKKIIQTSIKVVSIYIILYLLIKRFHFLLKPSSDIAPDDDSPLASDVVASLRMEPSDSLVWLISLLLISGAGAGIYLLWRKRQPKADSPLEDFRNKAEDALEQIRSGRDLRNTIIRCYAEMSDALSQHQEINREEMMTPREFETLLSGYALPQEPIRELTDLFEQVRYGKKQLGQQEEKKCRDCLSAIIHACQELDDPIIEE